MGATGAPVALEILSNAQLRTQRRHLLLTVRDGLNVAMVLYIPQDILGSRRLVCRGRAAVNRPMVAGLVLANAPALGWQDASDKPLALAMGYLTRKRISLSDGMHTS